MLAFPALKIGLLFFKQISKPIAQYVKDQTKTHPQVRRFFIRFAQSYHRLEVRMKRSQANLPPNAQEIRPLDDDR